MMSAAGSLMTAVMEASGRMPTVRRTQLRRCGVDGRSLGPTENRTTSLEEDAMPDTQSEVRALLDQQNDAIWNKDIDRLMSVFAPDIVYFDVVPPLQFVGTAALRGRFLDWFAAFKSPMKME